MIKNLILAALILRLLFLLSACGSAAALSGQITTDEAPSSPILTRAPADERAKGDPNAPVTLIEYGDYQ